MYDAPQKFADWMSSHRHAVKQHGRSYLYHSRSDKHSVALCHFVVADLLEASPLLKEKAKAGRIAYGINVPYTAPSGKVKNLDFAIGPPLTPLPKGETSSGKIALVKKLAELEISCEAKSTMTEHSKSKPRMYDELSSSHEIIHQGNSRAIATGIAVVNISQSFASPLRQKGRKLIMTAHTQPEAAAGMIRHLRGLKFRDSASEVGFDAFCTIVLDCDNLTCARLWTDPPAPQKGEIDDYKTYIDRVVRFYSERFA